MYIDILLKDETMVSFSEFVDIDYKINSSDNNELLLGNVSAASLNFSIWNGDKKWNTFKFKGSTIYLYKDVERTKKIGIFNIEKVTKNKNSLSFESMDNMTKLDEIFKGIQTPFSIWDLINQICSQLNIQLRNTEDDFITLTQKYDDTNEILGKKCRDIIKWIGEISCKYAIFDEDGKLYFNWYDLNTIKKELTYNKFKNFARDEEELNISKVRVIINNEEYFQGMEEGYDLVLSTDNPFLKTLDINSINSILQDIYSKVYGMRYLSCDISISADDEIKIGDTLKIYDEDGVDYKILVTYLNINKIFSMNITSAGENPDRNIKSSENTSGGGISQNERVYMTKNENWQYVRLDNYHGETFLNDITVSGINEKSNVYLSYSVNFSSTFENVILFRLYVNDMLSKTFYFTPKAGDNTFTWSETANINLDSDINVFKMTLDTSTSTLDNFIYIDKGMSSLSVITVGAKSAGSASVNSLEFKETVKPIKPLNPESGLLLVGIIDELIIDNKEYINNVVSEKVDLINFKEKNKLTIQ